MQKQTKNRVNSFRFFRGIYRGWNGLRGRFAAALDVDSARKGEIYTQLSTSASLTDLVYWLQLFFAAGIATLGMVLNSTAVVIGAMLISPLMAPILAFGLALSVGDITLGIRALTNLFLSSLLGVSVALLLVAFLPFKDITPEITARTFPNTLDLVIALFSGAIGSIAICRDVKGVATSIPGVAIAVALIPPLSALGFGLGYAVSVDTVKGLEIARGGGLLYLTNLVAITFSAMLVFVLLRLDSKSVRNVVHGWRDTDSESQWLLNKIDKIPALRKAREVRSVSLRFLMIAVPLLIIVFPLSESFSKMRMTITSRQTENRMIQDARAIWVDFEQDLDGTKRSYLDELTVRNTDAGGIDVYLRVFDNRPYTQGERKEFKRLLGQKMGMEPDLIKLQIVEIPTSNRDTAQILGSATPTPATLANIQADYLETVGKVVREINLPPHASFVDFRIISESQGSSFVEVFYLSEREVDADGISTLKEELREHLAIDSALLILTRIDSKPKTVSLKLRKENFDDAATSELIASAILLQRHPELNLRVMLKSFGGVNSASDERKKALTEFFLRNGELGSDRIFYDEAGIGGSEELQLFVGN